MLTKVIRPLSFLVLAISMAVTVYAGVGGAFPFWLIFFVQVAVILVCFVAIKATRARPPANWLAVSPVPLKYFIALVAVIGVALSVINLAAMVGGKDPQGASLTSLNWDPARPGCWIAYNGSAAVERPQSECDILGRAFGLTFSGFWLLFSAVAVWLSCLRASTEGSSVSRANISLQRP